MNRILLFIVCVLLFGPVSAQNRISSESYERLQVWEDSLFKLADEIINGATEYERTKACYKFIPSLVQALKVEGSFDYPFEKLDQISFLTPPDRSFRIITWQLRKQLGTHRYYGAIQMNSKKFTLFPLNDYSDSLKTVDLTQAILDEWRWHGSIYYNIYEAKLKRKKYYLLFGFDANDLFSNKKLIEVLAFDKGKPVFGHPVFQFESEDAPPRTQNRFMIEYSDDVTATMNYSEVHQMIIFDHLSPRDEKVAELRFTWVPDGTYEGFRLENGLWKHMGKVFHYSIDDWDNPPVPQPKDFEKEKQQMRRKP